MFKSAAVVAVATASALAAALGMVQITAARGAAQAAPVPAERASAAQVSKAPDGHFWAEAEVDGRWVRLLVDTGASSVSLTPADAQRLGVDLAALDFDQPLVTANGRTQAAAVTLDHVAVAGARVEKVEAIVVRSGLSTSLLGMSYLGRLSRFEASPTALILRP